MSDEEIVGIDENGDTILLNDEIQVKNEDGEMVTCEVLEADMNEDGMEITFVKSDGEEFTHNPYVEGDNDGED